MRDLDSYNNKMLFLANKSKLRKEGPPKKSKFQTDVDQIVNED